MSDGNENHPEPGLMPDISSCNAAHSEVAGLVYCLGVYPYGCKHARFLASRIFCFHPLCEKIAARTESNHHKERNS